MSSGHSLLRSSLVVSALSIAVSAISFANQLVIASVFGAGTELDRYFVAISVPMLIMGVFGGLWGYALVPILVRHRSSDPAARRIAGSFLLAFIVIGTTLALAGAAAAPAVLRLFSSGNSHAVGGPTTIEVARLLWVATGVNVIAGFFTAVANSARRFLVPLVAAALPYAGMIVCAVGFGHRAGVVALALGMCAGQLAGALLLAAVMRREFVIDRSTLGQLHEVRGFLAAVPFVLVSTLSFSVYQTIDAFWAPRLGAGYLSYFGYCQRLLIAIGTIMTFGPMTVIQPRLAEAIAQKRPRDFLHDTGRGLRLVLALVAPVALIVAILRHPLVEIAFQRGAFDSSATAGVAMLLPGMLTGMSFMLGVVLLFKALFAKGDLRSAVLLGLMGPVLYFTLSGVLSALLGAVGIAIAYAVTWFVLLVTGTARLWMRPAWALVLSNLRYLSHLGLALVVCGGVALATRGLVPPTSGLTKFALAVRAAVIGVGAVAGFLLVAAHLWPVEEVRAFVGSVMRLRGRVPATLASES